MTVYFNITDAISEQSNHGITRTERRLASALAPHGVKFVAIVDGIFVSDLTPRRS